MKKIIYRSISTLILIFFSLIIYLSTVGIETNRFNNQITKKINSLNKDIEIELKDIKLKLVPFKLHFNAKTLGAKLKSQNKIIELESIKTQIFLMAFLNEQFSLKNLEISTKPLQVKQLISFIRKFNKNTELLILENFIRSGYLIADLNIEFDQNGKIKENFNIKGFLKDGQIKLLKDNKIEKINFIFEIGKNFSEFAEIDFVYNGLNLFFEKITTKKNKNDILLSGRFNQKNILINKENIQKLVNIKNFDIEKINLNLNNSFSFKLDQKYKVNDFKINSKINLNKAEIINSFDLKNFFPEIKKIIYLKDHLIDLNYKDNELQIEGNGKILLQNNEDKIKYSIKKIGKKYNFETLISIINNPFKIDFLDYKNDKKNITNIFFNGNRDKDHNTIIETISLEEKSNQIKIEKVLFNKNDKVLKLDKAEFDYFDSDSQRNKFNILRKKDRYNLEGKQINADNFLENFINSDKKNHVNLFKKKIELDIKVDKIRLDNEFTINNLEGNLTLKNNDIVYSNLRGLFHDSKIIKYSVNSKNNQKVTSFFSGYAKPFVKRYKFIKGFENGSLDLLSIEEENKSDSVLTIYDFKLKEVPALTKLLTLASLQGIADLLSGEGIRFNMFEMKFTNQNSLMKIEEAYGIGPAISILMEGYIEKKKLISLRGTLVPATTLNKMIGSIPILGQILVGNKTGEGVFGVSFKIKGPPENLNTSVNPIKTLTPRFITRTLEKIKKLN